MLKILIQAKISELQERKKLKERPKSKYKYICTHIRKDRDKDTKARILWWVSGLQETILELIIKVHSD